MEERGISGAIIAAIVVVAGVGVYIFVGRQPGLGGGPGGSPGDNQPNGGGTGGLNMMYDIYPDTDEAPALEFFWDNFESLPSQITRVTPYGCWEDWINTKLGLAYEPAVEMQFYTTSVHNPVYAVAPCTILYVNRESGGINTRYGRNYGITYYHLENILENITPGLKVEAGTLLTYTETRWHEEMGYWEGWWEISLEVKRDNVFRSLPPFEYFSTESQVKLQAIIDASPTWDSRYGPAGAWTSTTGGSWTRYLPAPEWWASPARVGYYSETEETLQDFLNANNLPWTPVDLGRVVGPTDPH